MSVTKERYSDLLLAERGKWQIGNGEPILHAGACQFCDTTINIGWDIEEKATHKHMVVGSVCLGVLTALPKHQLKAIAYKERLLKHRVKYAPVVAYLIQTHGLRPLHEFFWMTEHNQRRNCQVCPEHKTAECWTHCNAGLGALIVDKCTRTASINDYWFDKYKERTGKDLKEMKA